MEQLITNIYKHKGMSSKKSRYLKDSVAIRRVIRDDGHLNGDGSDGLKVSGGQLPKMD